MSNCEKKKIKLYSSKNFTNPCDIKTFGKWNYNNNLKLLIKFIGQMNTDGQPDIFFKATVNLYATVNINNVVKKYNIIVNNVCFKNQFNVSASSRTVDYKYLYNISCSSADNASSKSSSSTCSSDLSLSDIYTKGIEKKIIDNISAFIQSSAFVISKVSEIGSYTLDTTQFNYGNTFPNVKMTIKNKFAHEPSTSSSSSSSSHKTNNFVKTLIIGFVALLIIIFFFKLLKNNNQNYSKLYNNVYRTTNSIFYKTKDFFKSLLYEKIEYPEYTINTVHEPDQHKPVTEPYKREPVTEPYKREPVTEPYKREPSP
jgi:hypothetical protein